MRYATPLSACGGTSSARRVVSASWQFNPPNLEATTAWTEGLHHALTELSQRRPDADITALLPFNLKLQPITTVE